MKRYIAGLVIPFCALLQLATPTQVKREVRGQTIVSPELPKAELTFADGYKFVGTQSIGLYGKASAEQFLFAQLGTGREVQRFYWIQFERFLPSNTLTYTYTPERTTQIGDLEFVYDVKSWPDYVALQLGEPGSDGEAMQRLLQSKQLSFPKRAVRVRMFHMPSPDHRSELMIIYGEAIPDGSAVPVRDGGVDLDKESPEASKTFLQHSLEGLKIQAR